MGIVIFDYENFIQLYPQFTDIPQKQLSYFFSQAELFCNNTAQSPVKNLTTREIMLNLLTCHLITLNQRGDQVGGVTSASEGGVSVSFAMPSKAGADYFAQSQYGYTFWQMSAPYRMCQYFAPRT